MAALPYIQLYVADYLADTMHLQAEEHGAYLLLIFNYWQTGKPIPKSRLQSISRVSNDRWISVEASLNEYFNDTGTHWQHSRIDCDLQMVDDAQTQRSRAGKASAEARKREKQAKLKREANDRSTPVKVPLQRSSNENSTNKETDTDTDTDTDIKEPSEKSERVNLVESTSESTDLVKPKPKRKKHKYSANHLHLAQRMADSVTTRFGSMKINLDEWADAVRKLHELDNIDMQEIILVWAWRTNHTEGKFKWADNCRTPMKLRERHEGITYFTMIQKQMRDDTAFAANIGSSPDSRSTRDMTTEEMLNDNGWALGMGAQS